MPDIAPPSEALQNFLGTSPLSEPSSALQQHVDDRGISSAPSPALQNFVSNEMNEEKFGGSLNQLKTAALGTSNSLSLGMIPRGLISSGLLSQETAKGLTETNPLSNIGGQMLGIGVGLAFAPEAAALKGATSAFKAAQATGDAIEIAQAAKALKAAKNTLTGLDIINPVSAASKIGGQVAGAVNLAPIASNVISNAISSGAGSAVEALPFVAGNINYEHALGDPALNSNKIISEFGFGAALGGALGIGGSLVHSGISGLFPRGIKEEAFKNSILDAAQENSPSLAPHSLDEIQARVKGADLPSGDAALPSKQSLIDASRDLPDLKYPAHQIQIQSLDDPMARDVYSTFLNTDSKEATSLRQYEALQKRDTVERLHSTIDSIAPESKITNDVVQGGEKAVKAFQDQYASEQKELSPLFQKFDKAAVNPVSYPGELVGRLEEAVPGISDHLNFEGIDGKVRLEKYEPSMPFSKNVYGGLKDLVSTINKEGTTLGDIRHLRNTIADRVNLLSAPRDYAQIGRLKTSLMDFIGNEIQKVEPDLSVKDIFKRYAINEQNRETIERIFGGKIGDRAAFAQKIKSEDVLPHIFGNTETVKAAKQIMGQGAFNEAAANYLSSQIAKASDSTRNGFSSAKFFSFLKSKAPELEEAFKSSPETLSRVQSLTNFMKILPDAPSSNPSGTAKTLDILMQANKVRSLFTPTGLLQAAAEHVKTSMQTAKRREVFNNILSGMNPIAAEEKANAKVLGYSVLKNIEDLTKSATSKIESGVKKSLAPQEEAIRAGAAKAGAMGAENISNREKTIKRYNKISEKISLYQQNPQSLMDTLEKSTAQIRTVAPEIAQHMQTSLAMGASFLASKLPAAQSHGFFQSKTNPSQAEMDKFLKYYDATEDPMSVLNGLKNNYVSPEGVETLATVFSPLYDEMKTRLLEKMGQIKQKPSYQKTLALSAFLNQDLEVSMAQPAIAANQMVFLQNNSPGQKDQGAVRSTSKGLGDITLANRAATPMQRASQRNEEA